MTTSTASRKLSPELDELTAAMVNTEPAEIRALRTGALPHRPGSYGQFFTTWDLANGILRDYAMNLYHLLRAVADEGVPVPAAQTVLRHLDPIYSTYLGYSGFPTLAEHAARLTRTEFASRAELIDALRALTAYANRLKAWSYHYFPWHVGQNYRYSEGEEAIPCPYSPTEGGPTPEPDPAAAVRVRLRWEPIGVTVLAALAGDLNAELCAEFVDALPFTVLQDHAVVTGESMYAWTPLTSIAPTPVTERICDAPAGRLRYSQSTGNKLVVQYGRTTETLRTPVLGQVVASDVYALDAVGKAVWESTFRTKELIWLTAELAP